ncbi:MAG: AMP-binding protein [Actinobacteria bacterium]|nr:AMP-binding protein [Actinomycetota bacterium]
MPTTYRYPTVPAARLLDDAAQDFPDVVAIEYRRYRLTYRKLLDHADRFATALADRGVGVGDQIVVVLPNCPQLIVALFAIWRIGGAVTLAPRIALASGTVKRARIVVTLERWYHATVAPVRATLAPDSDVIVTARSDYLPFPRNVLSGLRRRQRRIPESDRVLRFADLIRRSVPAPREPSAADRSVALSTDDTPVSQQQLVVNSFQLRLWLPDVVAGDERFLLAVPLTDAIGTVWMLTAVLSASTMVLVDEGRAAQRQRSALRARPTILPLDHDVTGDLLRASWRRGNLHSVRIALSVAPLDDHVRAQLSELTDKGRIRTAWGVGGLLTHADPIYGRAEQGSVGLPLPDTETVVLADGGSEPAVGVRGRLWVRGPQLHRSEWVDAGVEATLDTDGYLVVHPTDAIGRQV